MVTQHVGVAEIGDSPALPGIEFEYRQMVASFCRDDHREAAAIR